MTFKVGEYPVPSHAAYIWAAGDQLMIGFPPRNGQEKGHTASVPFNERGIGVLLALMRKRAEPEAKLAVGARAEPCAATLEEATASSEKYKQWLKDMSASKARRDAEKAEAQAFLAELGL